MRKTVKRKRSLELSDLYCEQEVLTSPESYTPPTPSTPPRKRTRCLLLGNVGYNEVTPCAVARTNPFDRLPDEVLRHIFSFLRRNDIMSCMATCSRFYCVGSDCDLWYSADYYARRFTEIYLVHEVLRGTKLLRASNSASRFQLEAPLELPRLRLQLLDLTNAIISKHLLLGLLKASHDLRKLSLENQSVCDELCVAIGRNRQLDTLNLCMTKDLTVKGITDIVTNCQQLVSLNVAWTTMDSACLTALVKSLPSSLKELNLAGYSGRLTDRHIEELCRRCPQMELLSISDNRDLSPAIIIEFVTSLRELYHLDISRCHRLYPQDLWELDKLPNFKHLSCYSPPDELYIEEIQRELSGVEVNMGIPLSNISRPQSAQYGPSKRLLWGVPMR